MQPLTAALLSLCLPATLWAQTPFGSGCPGAGGLTPAVALAGFPGSGLPWTLTLTGKAGSSSVLIVGASNQLSDLGPLPLALSGLFPALTGCSLLVSPDLLLPLTLDASGQAQLTVTGWNCGVSAHLQHWNLDFDAVAFTNLGGFSSGLTITAQRAGSLSAPGDVVITEIMKDPAFVFDAAGEWFEVQNRTAAPIDLSGWLLRDAGGESHRLQDGCNPILLQPGQPALLGVSADPAVNGGVTLLYRYSGFFLANGADRIRLEQPLGQLVDQVDYDSVLFPNQPGRSLALAVPSTDALLNDLGANWSASTCFLGGSPFNTDRGTPGAPNDQCGTTGPPDPTGEVIFCEVMQNPVGVSDDVGEWFELYNTTSAPIDLSGHTITAGAQSFTIAGPLPIPAGGYRLFLRNGNPAVNGGLSGSLLGAYDYPDGFVLGNASETLQLLAPGGQVLGRISYDNGLTFPDPSGASMSLDPGALTQAGSALGSNWCLGQNPYTAPGSTNFGSPGLANPPCP